MKCHSTNQILGDVGIGIQTQAWLKILNAMISKIQPKTTNEVLRDKNWIVAMIEELNQFENSRV